MDVIKIDWFPSSGHNSSLDVWRMLSSFGILGWHCGWWMSCSRAYLCSVGWLKWAKEHSSTVGFQPTLCRWFMSPHLDGEVLGFNFWGPFQLYKRRFGVNLFPINSLFARVRKEVIKWHMWLGISSLQLHWWAWKELFCPARLFGFRKLSWKCGASTDLVSKWGY